MTGHVSKDTDRAGQVGKSEDIDLAGQADIYTDKARHAFVHTEKARKKGHNTGKAGQSERDTLMGGQVDEYEDKTRRDNVDTIHETTSQAEKSGKRKGMELRRRSKIKVFIMSLFVPVL